MPRIGVGIGIGLPPIVAAAGGYDADAQAFFDRVATAGGTLTTTEKNATNQLVLDMKSAGIWTSMKAVYPMVGASVNLLSYTENFANGFWGGSSSKTPNYGVAPDGATTACRFFNGGYMQTQGISKGQGTYVFSFYVKMTSGGTGSLRVFLDGGVTTTTVNVTSNWARVQVTQTFASTDTGTAGFYTDSDVLIWHPQLELGSTATTYAPVLGNRTTEAAAACAQNLKSSSFTGTFTSGWTFASTGVTPNGTSAYLDSNFNPSTQFTANNNNHASYYIRNISNSSGTFPTEMGCYAAGVAVELNFKRPNQANLGSIFMGGTTSSLLSLSLNNGFLLATNLTSFRGFNNNTKIGTATLNSTNFPNYSIVLGANRNSATTIDPNTYSSKECAFASIGDGLTDTQASNFYTAVQAFNTTLSRQV